MRWLLPGLLLLDVCASATAANLADDRVVHYNGGPQHTGVYASPALRRLHGVALEFPVRVGISSPPLVHEGIVYFGDWGGSFYAVEIATGSLKWRHDSLGSVNGPPTIARGVAYWGSKSGVMRALDLETGELLWAYETEGARRGSDASICFPPLLEDGAAWFTSHDQLLYVVDTESGALRDTVRAGGSMCCSPSSQGDLVFITDALGNVYALDRATLEEQWHFKADKKIYHAPAILDGVAYLGSWDHGLYALDAATGTVRWRFEADERISSDPAVHQGRIYFNTLFSHVYALDAKTGHPLWDLKKDGLVYSKPALAGDMLYFGAGDSCLYALDAETGQERWRFKAGGMVSYPSIYDRKVLFGGGERLYVLE